MRCDPQEEPRLRGSLIPHLFIFLPFCPEAATKYSKVEQLTLRERLGRLNKHSIAKKTMRLSRLFMHEAGIVPKVRLLLTSGSQ